MRYRFAPLLLVLPLLGCDLDGQIAAISGGGANVRFPVAFKWEGVAESASGSLTTTTKGGVGGMSATLGADVGNCFGRWENRGGKPNAVPGSYGNWQLRCNQGLTATGTYRMTGERDGISLHGIDIDFWDAQRSWAHTQGHKFVRHLEDVVETTFFNVDAILYIVNERRIEAKPGTLEAIQDGYLDINLYPNPNPLGATLRALRRMCQHNMRASDELVAYIADQLDHYGWDRMSALDKSAYPASPALQSIAGPIPRRGSEFQELMESNENRLPLICQLPLFPYSGARTPQTAFLD